MDLRTSLPSTHAAASHTAAAAHQIPPKQRNHHHHQQNQQSQKNQQPKQKNMSQSPDPRHMAIALHHATRIQSQKDTESFILDRILDLVSYPRSPTTTDPSSASPTDIHAFKNALTPFQPADYDNLIQERNIEGLCGYGLCPREHRRDDVGGGGFRLKFGARGSGPGGRGREMNIVPKEKWEMWCSDECAERAMYVRVQLGEEPVWERLGESGRRQNLLLLEEGREQLDRGKGKLRRADSATVGQVTGQVTGQLGNMTMQPDMAEQIEGLSIGGGDQLALERGDSSSSALQQGRVDVHVRENQNILHHAMPPQLHPEDAQGGSIEGYMPGND